MAHSCVSCLMHCVFGTRHREPILAEAVRERLYAVMAGSARKRGIQVLAIGGTDDHVHLLLRLPATMSVAEAMH